MNELKRISGLERLYEGKQPWSDKYPELLPDPWGGDRGFVFNGNFDGAMETNAAESLYFAVRKHAYDSYSRWCRTHDAHTEYFVWRGIETGCCDGYSTCFYARAAIDAGPPNARIYTAELISHRSTEQPRPWPKLWDDLGLGNVIVGVYGDTTKDDTWSQFADIRDPKSVDCIFYDSDHTLKVVRAEWAATKRRLKPGAMLLFHDVYIFPEVGQAVGEIAAELGVQIEELNSSRGLAKIIVPDPKSDFKNPETKKACDGNATRRG